MRKFAPICKRLLPAQMRQMLPLHAANVKSMQNLYVGGGKTANLYLNRALAQRFTQNFTVVVVVWSELCGFAALCSA